MSKKILIVESDTGLIQNLRDGLEARGFEVDETTDGKGAVEYVRRSQPQLIVLAVELAAGQNGYLVCGKLKKDDDLKSIPVIIIGSPDGFAQHRKLKSSHADDYVAKPLEVDAVVTSAGGLIGFPELAPSEVIEESDGLDGPLSEEFAGEEIAVESSEATVNGDPELDLLDAAFEDLSEPVPEVEIAAESTDAGFETSFDAPESEPETVSIDESFEPSIEEAPEERTNTTIEAFSAAPTPPARTASPARSAPSPADAGELRTLRTRVSELESTLADVQSDASSAADRIRELESELEEKSTDLETARSSTGKSDKDTFALREAASKKDKEILRLKSELHEKDQELVELRDREMALEQTASGSADEIARRDAQIKTLTAKADQLGNDKKRVEQQLATSKDEARSASAQLSALQAELGEFQASQTANEEELEGLRARATSLEAELESLRDASSSAQSELSSARAELESVRETASTEAARYTSEADGLRTRVTELEETVGQHEERVTKLFARIQDDGKLRERTKKAVAIAMQLLEEHQPTVVEGGPPETDEEANA